MNTIRLRIFTIMVLVGFVPLSILAFGLRFLPGGVLPWLLYAVLTFGILIAGVAFSGLISRPLKDALSAMAQLMRSTGTYKPKAWVPKEYWALQDSLARLLSDERDQRAVAEKQLAEQGGAIAEAEAAAMRSIAVLNSVVDSCDEGLMFSHANGHITLLNDAAITQLALSEEMQQPGAKTDTWLTSLAASFKDNEELSKTWVDWQNGPGLQEGEWTTADNRQFVVRTIDVRHDDGVLLGRLWVFRNVTEQRQMHIRLQESQKMESMGQLAGGIAHDFNNLLTAIRGNLTLAELNVNDREGYRSKIDDASRAASRAAELVNQILGYSRKGRAARTVTDVNQVIGEVRNILRASLDPKVALRVTLPKDIWSATADPVQIEQVLLNLCLNARDALPETGGQIDISAASINKTAASADDETDDRVGDFVVIRVKDNGSGIPVEARERVFEPFYTTKDQGKGTGLGLAMARSIVEQCGGWVELDSEVGKGTEFRLFLPRSLEASPPKPTELTRAVTPSRGSAEGTVLVVDDEAPVRSIAVNMLKYLGYKVLEAQDGEEAISILMSDSTIDAVMMDVYMPKLSGRDTYRQMNTLGLDVPVIVCSGFMVEPDEFTSLGQGRHSTVEVIQKPYSMEALAKVVAKAIEKGRNALVA